MYFLLVVTRLVYLYVYNNTCTATDVCTHMYMYSMYTYVHCLYTGALSVIDSDDDYCVSYIVTMVDVRSCTRPPRSLGQDRHPSMCMFRSAYIYIRT